MEKQQEISILTGLLGTLLTNVHSTLVDTTLVIKIQDRLKTLID